MIVKLLTKSGAEFLTLDCVMTFPIAGAWTAMVEVHTPDLVIDGQVVVSFGGDDGTEPMLAVATVDTSSAGSRYTETASLVLVGGFGGFGDVVSPRAYRSATARQIVDDVMKATGEALSPASDFNALAATLPWWVRPRGTGGSSLSDLCRYLGLVWRVLLDGKTWVGPETWPESEYSSEILNHDPASRTLTISAEYPAILPGVTWQGQKIQSARVSIGPNENRTVLRYDDEFAATLRKTITSTMATAVVTGQTFPGRVVAQRGDRVDVKIDDASLPIAAVSDVPMRFGLPGVQAVVPAGANVLVAFEGGSLARPYVAQWLAGCPVTSITVGGSSTASAREGGTVDCGQLIVSSGLVVGYVAGNASIAERAAALAAGGVGAVAMPLTGQINPSGSKMKV